MVKGASVFLYQSLVKVPIKCHGDTAGLTFLGFPREHEPIHLLTMTCSRERAPAVICVVRPPGGETPEEWFRAVECEYCGPKRICPAAFERAFGRGRYGWRHEQHDGKGEGEAHGRGPINVTRVLHLPQ